MIKLVNLTPEAITICDADGKPVQTIPPSGKVAQISTRRDVVGFVNGIPLHNVRYGDAKNLPRSEIGTIFIVPTVVRQALFTRPDVVSPSELIRDSKGNPVGHIGFDTNL